MLTWALKWTLAHCTLLSNRLKSATAAVQHDPAPQESPVATLPHSQVVSVVLRSSRVIALHVNVAVNRKNPSRCCSRSAAIHSC